MIYDAISNELTLSMTCTKNSQHTYHGIAVRYLQCRTQSCSQYRQLFHLLSPPQQHLFPMVLLHALWLWRRLVYEDEARGHLWLLTRGWTHGGKSRAVEGLWTWAGVRRDEEEVVVLKECPLGSLAARTCVSRTGASW